MREKLIIIGVTIPFFVFGLLKPKIFLKVNIWNNEFLCKKIFRMKKLWSTCRWIGIDENNNLLPDAEKRFRIYTVIAFLVTALVILLLPI